MISAYESEELLHQYLFFHYGRPEEILPYDFGPAEALGFPARSVLECINLEKLPSRGPRPGSGVCGGALEL